MVLHWVTLATKDPIEGKLAPNWEGPYKVIECKRAGAYHLEDSNDKALPKPWNAEYHKKYYVYVVVINDFFFIFDFHSNE